MTPNSPPTITLENSDEKILAILNPDAVFKDPKAEGRKWLEQYAEKRKEEATDEH